MKVVNIKITQSLVTIETETPRKFLWIKIKPIKRKFAATKQIAKGLYNWVELPEKTIVPDRLSFQLDAWVEFANAV